MRKTRKSSYPWVSHVGDPTYTVPCRDDSQDGHATLSIEEPQTVEENLSRQSLRLEKQEGLEDHALGAVLGMFRSFSQLKYI